MALLLLANDRVAADADAGRLADAGPGQLVNRFVDQRSGARDNADVAGHEDVGRMDPDAAIGCRLDDPRTVRPDQLALGIGQRGAHANPCRGPVRLR